MYGLTRAGDRDKGESPQTIERITWQESSKTETGLLDRQVCTCREEGGGHLAQKKKKENEVDGEAIICRSRIEKKKTQTAVSHRHHETRRGREVDKDRGGTGHAGSEKKKMDSNKN